MLSTKKDSHDLKVELLYLAGMFRPLSPGASISVALRKLLQGGRGEVRLYTTLQQRKQAVWTSKVRYQVKEFSILCAGRCKPLGSLNSLPSHTPQLSGTNLLPFSPCFLHPSSSLAMTLGVEACTTGSVWGPSFTLEARNRWWLRHFSFTAMAGDVFVSHS